MKKIITISALLIASLGIAQTPVSIEQNEIRFIVEKWKTYDSNIKRKWFVVERKNNLKKEQLYQKITNNKHKNNLKTTCASCREAFAGEVSAASRAEIQSWVHSIRLSFLWPSHWPSSYMGALHTIIIVGIMIIISSIIIIGALLQISSADDLSKYLAAFAILITSINRFGGFAVTQRMLAMFRKWA